MWLGGHVSCDRESEVGDVEGEVGGGFREVGGGAEGDGEL